MKKLFVAASLCCLAAAGWAQPQRSLFTHENKFPEYHEAEVGGLVNYSEFEFRDERTFGAYARYTILTNLTLNTTVPFKTVTPDGDASEESGLGDIHLGLDLVAYEDIFEYPYVIPHVDVALSTGDEEDGLGTGKTVTTLGISLGTVTHDCLHWIIDFSYAIDGGSEEDVDNLAIFGGALVWDVSKKFSVLAEGRVTDAETDDGDEPTLLQGGMTYQFTKNFMMGWYFGAGSGGDEDTDGTTTIKGAYTF